MVVNSSGRVATAAGALVFSLAELSASWAVSLDAGRAHAMLAVCGALGPGSLPPGASCDSEAMWAMGYAIEGVAPLLDAFPALLAAADGGTFLGVPGRRARTGSSVWDAVALHAEACSAAAPVRPGWTSFGCLLQGQEALARLIAGSRLVRIGQNIQAYGSTTTEPPPSDGRSMWLHAISHGTPGGVRGEHHHSLADAALRMRAVGGRSQAKLYPGLDHADLIATFSPLFRKKATVLADVTEFFHRQLG
jgi:hypothetical protein